MKDKIAKQFAVFKELMTWQLAIIFLGYAFFAIIFSFLVKNLAKLNFLNNIDISIAQFVISLRSENFILFSQIFTNLQGEKIMILLTFGTALIFFLKQYYRYSIGIILSIGASQIMSFILKEVVSRQRPPESLALTLANSASFPSGHSIAAISFYGFLAYFFYKNTKNKTLKNALIIVCGLLILSAGLARVYLGVHWPSDIIGGYIIGGAWLFIVLKFIKGNTTLEN